MCVEFHVVWLAIVGLDFTVVTDEACIFLWQWLFNELWEQQITLCWQINVTTRCTGTKLEAGNVPVGLCNGISTSAGCILARVAKMASCNRTQGAVIEGKL